MCKQAFDFIRTNFFIVVLLILTVALGKEVGRATEPLRIDVPKLIEGGALQLRVQGTTGTRYNLEVSTNLSSWTLLSSGVAQSNSWTSIQNTAVLHNPFFFRARTSPTNPSTPEILLFYREDTNQVAQVLITTNGGSFDVYTADTLRITLTVPPNTLPEPTFVSMSLVTNVTGMPFAKGSVTTLKLEPSGLPLWGAAQVDIARPPGIPFREIVTFTADTDGTGFSLIPGLVYTNRVSIPITQLGLVGVALASDAELAPFSATNSITEPATLIRTVKTLRLSQSTSDDCQAGLKQVATAAAQQIQHAIKIFSGAIAVDLAQERRNQLLGSDQDSHIADILQRAADDACLIYHNLIEPRWSEAAGNCALAGVLTQYTLSLERQRQLLGSTHTDCGSLSAIPFCSFESECLREIRECCASGHRGPDLIRRALGLERQDQLLGSDCNLWGEVQKAIDECSSNAWTGTFTVNMSGQESTSSPGVTEDKQIQLLFQGTVIESTETDAGAAGSDVSLRVRGQFQSREYDKRLESSSSSCPGSTNKESRFFLSESETTAAATTEYRISIAAQNGKYSMTALHFYSPTTGEVPGKERRLVFSRFTPCGSEPQDYRLASNDAAGVGSPPLIFQGPLSSTNSISGSQISDANDSPPTQLRFDWQFQRHEPGE